MKVLLLFPQQDLQTGTAIQRAFENLGHTIHAVDAKLHPLNSASACADFKPDLVFCSRTATLTEQVGAIKANMPRVIVAVWNVDVRSDFYFYRKLHPLFGLADYLFLVEHGRLNRWRAEVNPNTYWLPQGLQEETYNCDVAITPKDREKYTCDVSFAGGRSGVHGKRNLFLRAVEASGIDFKQWGAFDKPKVYDKEHCKAVMLSKINLGCSGWPEVGNYVSVRDVKILGSGGFLLERDGKGLNDVVPCKGKNRVMDFYTSPQDLINKIRYWLEHEDERKAIAKRGHYWVHKYATYTDRMRQALEIIGFN